LTNNNKNTTNRIVTHDPDTIHLYQIEDSDTGIVYERGLTNRDVPTNATALPRVSESLEILRGSEMFSDASLRSYASYEGCTKKGA
jgi:hypothetical protein